MWQLKKNRGLFGESGCVIDHKKEYAIGGSSDVSNLQALCYGCHALKTVRFMNNLKNHKNNSKSNKQPKTKRLVKKNKKLIKKIYH